MAVFTTTIDLFGQNTQLNTQLLNQHNSLCPQYLINSSFFSLLSLLLFLTKHLLCLDVNMVTNAISILMLVTITTMQSIQYHKILVQMFLNLAATSHHFNGNFLRVQVSLFRSRIMSLRFQVSLKINRLSVQSPIGVLEHSSSYCCSNPNEGTLLLCISVYAVSCRLMY